eukprot:jgi/Bigna1/143166/aug1.76_g17874
MFQNGATLSPPLTPEVMPPLILLSNLLSLIPETAFALRNVQSGSDLAKSTLQVANVTSNIERAGSVGSMFDSAKSILKEQSSPSQTTKMTQESLVEDLEESVYSGKLILMAKLVAGVLMLVFIAHSIDAKYRVAPSTKEQPSAEEESSSLTS